MVNNHMACRPMEVVVEWATEEGDMGHTLRPTVASEEDMAWAEWVGWVWGEDTVWEDMGSAGWVHQAR